MFNNNVISVLNSINKITDTLIIKYPVTYATSESQDILFEIDISQLDSDEFPNVYLFKSLPQFVGLMRLFGDNRKVNFSENIITISSEDNSQKSSLVMHNPALFQEVQETQIEKTKEFPSVAEFDLTTDDFKNMTSALGILKDLDEITIKTVESGVEFILGSGNRYEASSDNYSILKECDTSKEFEVKFDAEKLSLIPPSDYTMQIKYNSTREAYRVLLINKKIPLTILLALRV